MKSGKSILDDARRGVGALEHVFTGSDDEKIADDKEERWEGIKQGSENARKSGFKHKFSIAQCGIIEI